MDIKASTYLLSIAKRFKGGLTAMGWVAFFWAFDLCARPYLLKTLLDGLQATPQGKLMGELALPLGLFIFIPFLMSLTFRLYNYCVEIRMIPSIRAHVLEHAIKHLLRKNHTFFQNQYAGDLSDRVSNLVDGVPELFQVIMDRFLAQMLALLFAIYTLWQVSWMFAALMLGWGVCSSLGAWLVSPLIRKRAVETAAKGALSKGGFVDTFGNILSVKLFAHIQQEWSFLKRLSDAYVQAERRLQWTYFFIWMVYGFLYLFMHAFNLYLLMNGFQAGWISVGDVALVITLNASIGSFIWELMRAFSQFSKLMGRIQQALTALGSPEETPDMPHAQPLRVSKGEIIFEEVAFAYPNTPPLFQEKSVRIASGEKVGLVGYSGGGKTTFINLILRLHEVSGGRILIDGQDIVHVTQRSLRNAIGVIPQDTTLFHRNLLENIRYGRQDADDEAVKQAAKRAHAHSFIEVLPQGYTTLVGERGVKLSGGQRQRIAIARAFLKDAPILILDEATSQLDSLTEEHIQQSLWKLMEHKTTLVVAHRLSTLLRMDRILVFEQGKIVEDGPHQKLLQRGGRYKTLWEAQIGGFLPDTASPL